MGINDLNVVYVRKNEGAPEKLQLKLLGNSDIFPPPGVRGVTLLVGGEQQSLKLSLPKQVVLFNSISDPLICSFALETLEQVIMQTGLPVINDPKNIKKTEREKLSKSIEHPKIKFPMTAGLRPYSKDELIDRIEMEFDYPVLVRRAFGEGSKALIRLDRANEHSKLDRFAFDGMEYYYVMEFIDYKDDEGLYRKYRVNVIDGEVIPVHLWLSTGWQIHTKAHIDSDLRNRSDQEEKKYFRKNPHKEIFVELSKELGLDFFGVDYALLDDQIIIFELNAMTMIGKQEKLKEFEKKQVKKVHNKMRELINSRIY